MLGTATSLQNSWQQVFKDLFPRYFVQWSFYLLRTLCIFELKKVHNRKLQAQRFLVFWFVHAGFYCMVSIFRHKHFVDMTILYLPQDVLKTRPLTVILGQCS